MVKVEVDTGKEFGEEKDNEEGNEKDKIKDVIKMYRFMIKDEKSDELVPISKVFGVSLELI